MSERVRRFYLVYRLCEFLADIMRDRHSTTMASLRKLAGSSSEPTSHKFPKIPENN